MMSSQSTDHLSFSQVYGSWKRGIRLCFRPSKYSMMRTGLACMGCLRLLFAQSIPLALDPLAPLFREALDPCEDRIRIQVRLGDHFRFQTAGKPLVVPIRSKRISVRQWA